MVPWESISTSNQISTHHMKSQLVKFAFFMVALISLPMGCECDHEKCPGQRKDVFYNTKGAVIFRYDPYSAIQTSYTLHRYYGNRITEVFRDGVDQNKDSIDLSPSIYDYELAYEYEVRLSNGWSSTLNDPFIYLNDTTYRIECPELDDTEDELDYYEVKVVRRKIDSSLINMPPLFLHLTCNETFDATSGNFYRFGADYTSKGKRWKYVSITDDQGADLTTHPDWACIADNQYWFLKEMKIAYYPGVLFCDGENIPEYRLDSYLYFGYSISVENPGNFENPGKIQIRTNVSNYVEDVSDVVFTITSSDFDELVGTIEVDGRTANFVAQPL